MNVFCGNFKKTCENLYTINSYAGTVWKNITTRLEQINLEQTRLDSTQQG